MGEHWQEGGDRVVEEVEAGDEGPRIAEPRGQRVGGVARDDVVAAAFDDREIGRQEPLDVGPREEPAVLPDRPPQPRIDLPDQALDSGKRVGQMKDEQRAAWHQDPGKFHERRPLVAARFVHVFEHADTRDGVKHGV